jgi:hypothetical protein
VTSQPPLRIESLCDDEEGAAARQVELRPEVRALHREVLRAFLTTGVRPHRQNLALADGVDRDEAFRRLRDADLVHLDADGYVRAAYPFCGRMTGHIVQLADGPVVNAMCAIDALGIPLMTGLDALITSNGPDDAKPIRVERRGDRWRWTPGGTVVLLAQNSGRGSAADCLCPATTFHTSRQGAEDYLRRHPELTGRVLDRVQAVDVSRWSFGSLLASKGGE